MAKQVFDQNPFELTNPYHNNLAQTIEILHFLEEIRRLVGELAEMDLSKAGVQKAELPKKTVKGQAALEAPRGILIHQVEIDKTGQVTNYNIVPPTQINLASLIEEAQQLVDSKSTKSMNEAAKQSLEKDIEMMIRAFDPCITCAVH